VKGTKRGKGTKLGEGERDFWDYYADLWFDSGFLCLGRLHSGLFRSGKVRGAKKSTEKCTLFSFKCGFVGGFVVRWRLPDQGLTDSQTDRLDQ